VRGNTYNRARRTCGRPEARPPDSITRTAAATGAICHMVCACGLTSQGGMSRRSIGWASRRPSPTRPPATHCSASRSRRRACEAYRFWYTAGRLDSVVAPRRTRRVGLPADHQRRGVTTIRDPDNSSVAFGYTTGDTNRIVSRTDRRLHTTYFAYDATKKIVKDSLDLGGGTRS